MLDVRKLLAQRPLLFDGGMGTYYKAKPGQECEQANLLDPDGILTVHRAYLEAGADAIKTKASSVKAYVVNKDMKEFELKIGELTDDERRIILAGCLINFYKEQ